MTFLKSIIFFILIISGFDCAEDAKPIVKTPLGQIRGYHKQSHGGKKFSAFEGIPFAKPPIGSRRFKEPEPAEPWDGIWDANTLTECAQNNPGIAEMPPMPGNEDCLYINVYVPRDQPLPTEELDVLVDIHGGAFMFGSGHMYANPGYVMDRNLIYITFNYRLGLLGFLSTEDDVVPGNNGLKDQVMALKWVQKNIASFGGNPRSVTLTGMSAGGASVHFHYFSPLSKGLFHRGISQSGTALNVWAIPEEPLQKAQMLAHSVGCPTSSSKAMVDCLRQRPVKQLLDKVGPLYYGYLFTPLAPFAPVVEKGSNPFLDKNPYYLLSKGLVHDLPWLASNVQHEGLMLAKIFQHNLEEIDAKWTEVAPFLLDYNYTLAKVLFEKSAQEIKDFYIGADQHFSSENWEKFVQIFSDRLFLVDAEMAVKMQARSNKSPVYYYIFSYTGDNEDNLMVTHGGDGAYFYMGFGNNLESPNDLKVKDIILDLFTSFIKTGKPKIPGVVWEPTGHEELKYLNISTSERSEIKQQVVKQLTPKNFWESQGFLENQNLVLIKDEL